MDQDFDLFGLPIIRRSRKQGRPPHLPNDETVSKVNMLLAFGRKDDEIAAALGISEPTLRKHYLPILKRRDQSRLQAEAWLLQRLATQVDEGNVAAMKEMGRRFDKNDMALLSAHVQQRGRAEPKPQQLGKKEQQQADAKQVDGKFAPPSAPRLN